MATNDIIPQEKIRRSRPRSLREAPILKPKLWLKESPLGALQTPELTCMVRGAFTNYNTDHLRVMLPFGRHASFASQRGVVTMVDCHKSGSKQRW